MVAATPPLPPPATPVLRIVGAGRLPGSGPAGQAPGSRAGTPRCEPHAAAFRGLEKARWLRTTLGLVPRPLPLQLSAMGGLGRWGRAGANLELINRRHLLKKRGVGVGGEVNAEVGAAGPEAAPSTPNFPRRLLASEQMAGSVGGRGAGAAGPTHVLPHP